MYKKETRERGCSDVMSSSIAKHLDLPPLIEFQGMNISGSPSAKTIEDKHDDQMWPRADFRFSRACREIRNLSGASIPSASSAAKRESSKERRRN